MAKIYRALRYAKALASGSPKVSSSQNPEPSVIFTIPAKAGDTPLQASFSNQELFTGIEFAARCFRDMREGYSAAPATDADILKWLRWK